MRRDGDRRSHAARRSAPAGADRGVAAAVRPQVLRGDVLAGIAVTAMIVPKDLGYAGIAGVPVQNGLYAAAAGAIVYALFCTSRHISTGPSSSLAAVAGGAVLFTGVARRGRGRARRGDHAGDRRVLPPARRASPRLDRAVPLPGGRDGLPCGSRGRRRHRRAAEADRDSTSGDTAWGRARVVAPVARRRELDDRARGRGGARRSSSACASSPLACRARSCSSSEGCSRRGSSTWARTVSRSSAPSRAACPRRRSRASTSSSSTTRRSSRPRPGCS